MYWGAQQQKSQNPDRSGRRQLNLEHSISNSLMELLIFFRNPTGNSINLVLCVVIFAAVTKVNGGLRQSRRAPSPSGTKPSSTPTFTDGTSGNACSRSQCGISPESKRRRVNSWERWGIQHGHWTAAKSSRPHLLLKYINSILIPRY